MVSDDTSSHKAYSNDTEDHLNANTSQATNSEVTLANTMNAEEMEAEYSEEIQQAYQQQIDVEADIQGQENSVKSDCPIIMKQIPQKCVIKALKF